VASQTAAHDGAASLVDATSADQRNRADLVTALLSREVTNDSITVMGTGTPLTAVATLLALSTHAPLATYTSPLAGGIGILPHEVSLDLMESAVFDHAVMRSAQIIDLWEMATINPRTADRWLQFFRPAQLDAYGNINNSVIKRPDGRVLRLPGSVGIGDMAAFYPRLFAYVPRHQTSAFPEVVDFVSAPGTLGTVAQREARGLRWGRPYKVITDLCIFMFNDDGRAIIHSIHPGRSAEEVAAATGFTIDATAEYPVTAGLTEIERDGLDAVDPLGLRFLEVLGAKPRQEALRRILRR
jgi:acyl CoA:acetate/3-ketoacid CoA transferase beta subunit